MLPLLLAFGYSFIGECELCKFAAKEVQKLLIKKVEKADIPALIEKECDKLPYFLPGICKKLADIPYEKIIEVLENKGTPTEACLLIKLCKKVKANGSVRRPERNGPPVFQTETKPQWSVSWEEQI